MLETGSRVPADCLLIDGTDISVDERFYHPEGHRDIKVKTVAVEDNLNESPDPFIFTESLVESGSGKALVCAVGKYSCRGDLPARGLEDNEEQTPL